MDPWIDNPLQKREGDVLGLSGTFLAKVIVACWCFIAALGLLWFWPNHQAITTITTLASICAGVAFLAIKQDFKNKLILNFTFYAVFVLAILSYLVQG